MPIIKTSNVKGQTMIETVIALAVVMILVSSLISMSIASVRSASLSRSKNAASQLAYKESELIRNARDSSTSYNFDWSLLQAGLTDAGCSATSHCKVDPSTILFASNDKTDGTLVFGTTFTIYFLVNSISGSAFSYTVKVEWTDSLGLHTESISSILTPWK